MIRVLFDLKTFILCLFFNTGQPSDDSDSDGAILCNGANDGDNESMADASDIEFSSPHFSLATGTASANDQQTMAATTPQHSNIILIRGARTDNGQIILQNSQELLNLLNGTGTVSFSCEDEKLIQLPHSAFKTTTTDTTTATKTTKDAIGAGHSIFVQSPMRPSKTAHKIVDIKTASTGGQTIVRMSSTNRVAATTKKSSQASNAYPEGSIFLQQRLNKNVSTDVPILLQTLKRLDKSPSILLFRNAQSTNSTLTSSTVTMKTTAATAANHMTVINNANAKENTSSSIVGGVSASANKTVSSNIPLGTGEFNSMNFFSSSDSIVSCKQSRSFHKWITVISHDEYYRNSNK